jgi:two-component sensor histidine kinase
MSGTTAPTEAERRVLILLPSRADGAGACRILAGAGIQAVRCATGRELCAIAETGIGALVLAEEVLLAAEFRVVCQLLDRQPAWSDVPLVVVTVRSVEPTRRWRSIAQVSSARNVALLERPMRPEMLIQAVRVGLRARDRQYRLRASIAEREGLLVQRGLLIREIHHRVRNNLQIACSLVRMSAQRAPAAAQPMFEDILGRLSAFSHLHSRIYASAAIDRIDAAAYLGDILADVGTALGAAEHHVRIEQQVEAFPLDVDKAVPVGLIATELLTNALRYAFPDGASGEIRIALTRRDDSLELTVADSGVGLPTAQAPATSTGLRLVQALVHQLKGTFEITSGRGVTCRVAFPLGATTP